MTHRGLSRLLAVAALLGGAVVWVAIAVSLPQANPSPSIAASPSAAGVSALISCARIDAYPPERARDELPGAALPMVVGPAPDADMDQRMLYPLLGPDGGGVWLIIEAPRSGEVRLAYRRHGQGPVLFDVIVREG